MFTTKKMDLNYTNKHKTIQHHSFGISPRVVFPGNYAIEWRRELLPWPRWWGVICVDRLSTGSKIFALCSELSVPLIYKTCTRPQRP